jgi:hypothetical protein
MQPERNPAGPERLAIPHTFPPQLTLLEALVATCGAFLRILLGSMLFASWGVSSLALWQARQPLAPRLGMLALAFLGFVLAFGLMLVVVRTLVRAATPRLR